MVNLGDYRGGGIWWNNPGPFLGISKAQKKYLDETNKINRDIEDKIKRDTAAGMKKAETIKAQAIANNKKEIK